MQVVINKCHGGFSLSDAVFEYLIEKKGWKFGVDLELTSTMGGFFSKYAAMENEDDISFRSNPDVIEAIEHLGIELASGQLSELKIIEVPDGIPVIIEEHAGKEWVREVSRAWS